MSDADVPVRPRPALAEHAYQARKDVRDSVHVVIESGRDYESVILGVDLTTAVTEPSNAYIEELIRAAREEGFAGIEIRNAPGRGSSDSHDGDGFRVVVNPS